MTKNKVVVLGVTYPGLEAYLDDYFMSLSNQSYKNYDIWIFNDGLEIELLKEYRIKYHKLNIYFKNLNKKYTPAKIREMAIIEIKHKYDFLIFTDVDDYFNFNRIEKSINGLQNYDFCYNDLIIVDSKGERLGHNTYFKNKHNPRIVNDFDQLATKNFCGLSNTAVNLKNINFDFLMIPKTLIAVDWWIFSILLIKGYRGCFLDDTYTYYRQHEANIVGGLNKIDGNQFIKALKIKKKQYKSLLDYYPSKYNDCIRKEFNNILTLEKKIKENTYFEKCIIDINNKNREFMWWEYI